MPHRWDPLSGARDDTGEFFRVRWSSRHTRSSWTDAQSNFECLLVMDVCEFTCPRMEASTQDPRPKSHRNGCTLPVVVPQEPLQPGLIWSGLVASPHAQLSAVSPIKWLSRLVGQEYNSGRGLGVFGTNSTGTPRASGILQCDQPVD